MRIAITGHRPDKLDNDYDLASPLIADIKIEIERFVRKLIFETDGNLTLVSGMALGIDTLFAKIAIENNLPFIAALPCAGQQNRWPEKSRKRYSDIISNPLCEIHYVSSAGYTNFCMQKRNEWMVDNSDILIAVWDGSSGGQVIVLNTPKK